MSDRDELMQVIKHAPSGYDRVADAVIAAGYRKVTVTPEQLLAVVQILDDVPAVRLPETWMRKARDIARVFGPVPEEEPKLPLCGDFVGDGLRCDQPQSHVGHHSNRNW